MDMSAHSKRSATRIRGGDDRPPLGSFNLCAVFCVCVHAFIQRLSEHPIEMVPLDVLGSGGL